MESLVCNGCDKEFEYNDNDEIEQWDEDYNGNNITYWIVFCPHCGESNRVRG